MSAGTVINSLLGLAFYIFIARILGPSDFGNFSYLMGFGLLAAEVGDLGLGSAIVRFGSGSELAGIFTITFIQRIIAAIVFFGVAFFASGNFYLSAIVATSLQFLSLVTQTFLARQKYALFVVTNIFGNISRLFFVWISSNSTLNVTNSLYAFSAANFIAFLLGMLMLGSFPLSFIEAKKMF